MGPGTPIYYDMEGYSPSGSCSRTVMAFISAWTRELHHLGYKSGAYGNPGSLMTDMSRSVASPGFAPPDNVWFAHWNRLRNTSDQGSYPGFRGHPRSGGEASGRVPCDNLVHALQGGRPAAGLVGSCRGRASASDRSHCRWCLRTSHPSCPGDVPEASEDPGQRRHLPPGVEPS